jgi:hypothetical protein
MDLADTQIPVLTTTVEKMVQRAQRSSIWPRDLRPRLLRDRDDVMGMSPSRCV